MKYGFLIFVFLLPICIIRAQTTFKQEVSREAITEWMPVASSVQKDQVFLQTRQVKVTYNFYEEQTLTTLLGTGSLIEVEKRQATGTQPIEAGNLIVELSKSISEWAPAALAITNGESFTQTRTVTTYKHTYYKNDNGITWGDTYTAVDTIIESQQAIGTKTEDLSTSTADREINQIKILFQDLRDVAACLNLSVDDCDRLRAKANTYDAAKWLGYLYCKEETVPTCSDCYTHIDGVNVIGVIPIITEKIFEPVLCATTRFKNHSIDQMKNITSLTSNQDVASWTRKVTWQDILKVSNIANPTQEKVLTEVVDFIGNSPLVVPNEQQWIAPSSFQNGPIRGLQKRAIIDTGVFAATPIAITSTSKSAADPILDTTQQTSGTNNYVREYEYASTRLEGTLISGVKGPLKLCGVTYSVRGIGSVHPSAYEAYAHVVARANDIMIDVTNVNERGSVKVNNAGLDSVSTSGQLTIGYEKLKSIDPITGLWNCEDVQAIDINPPMGSVLPSSL